MSDWFREDCNKEAWAFTYKALGDRVVTPATYTSVLDHLNKNGEVKHVRTEDDPSGRPHIHGIVLLKKGFYRKRLIQLGFHCHLKTITNIDGWMSYCNKGDVLNEVDDQPLFLFDPKYECN